MHDVGLLVKEASTNSTQAQKFKNLDDNDSDDELGEESLLDTPLDKVEPYQLFKNALLSKPYHRAVLSPSPC